MTADLVTFGTRESVGHSTLCRPEVGNAIDLATADALGAAVAQAGEDEAVRAILVTGAGSRFCTGGDVKSMAGATDRAAYVHELAGKLSAVLDEVAVSPKPVVAAVQGVVAGAGLGVLLAADVVVAARSTGFSPSYVGVGLTPDCGVSYRLSRSIGEARALAWVLSGDVISAQTALKWGLIWKVADDGAEMDSGLTIAARLAENPPLATAEAKRLIRISWTNTSREAAVDEAATIANAITTSEAASSIDRFISPSN